MSSAERTFTLLTSMIESNGLGSSSANMVANLNVLQGPSAAHLKKSPGITRCLVFWRFDHVCRVDIAKQHLGTKDEGEAAGDVGDSRAWRRSFSEELMCCEARDDKSCIAKCSGCF
ncbi:hypothetical protein NL676_000086 [Syzygium grande]|nr:hypothetical protein NL676_000086 [Syzygium grande]